MADTDTTEAPAKTAEKPAPAPAPVAEKPAPAPAVVAKPSVKDQETRLQALQLAVGMRQTSETKQMLAAAKAFTTYLNDGGTVDALKIAIANHPLDQPTEIVNYAGVYQHYLETGEVQ